MKRVAWELGGVLRVFTGPHRHGLVAARGILSCALYLPPPLHGSGHLAKQRKGKARSTVPAAAPLANLLLDGGCCLPALLPLPAHHVHLQGGARTRQAGAQRVSLGGLKRVLEPALLSNSFKQHPLTHILPHSHPPHTLTPPQLLYLCPILR